ncbi:unnamed protein product [Ambrosiozyma monospora]|uniref:Unnamed protein product n=1 Tax=Ambrosiozyma monospora TaxID=43982 RepID=A0ACB5TK67_AMBMO|nr:unnamed protein product [Ambrosiozyma monospora]
MIGYCGTGYNGMQIQDNQPQFKTIEGDIFKALVAAGAVSKNNSNDLKKNDFMRAARTDKGVHAAGNVISLKMIIEDEDIVEKINAQLPEQIRVWGYSRVNKGFDCRKMCSSRVYEYLLPTYSFLPPNPSSPLGEVCHSKELEDAEFWDPLEEEAKKRNIDMNIVKDALVAQSEGIETTMAAQVTLQAYKKMVREMKTKYRTSAGKLAKFQETLNLFKGHHNFHNFTVGKDYRDKSANRYMLNFKVSEPFEIEGIEWVSVKVHGQSFMLHQIRKMIGLTTMIVRTGAPSKKLLAAFKAQKVNIPKAPALGLLLEQPVYDGYREYLERFGYQPLSFEKYEAEMEAFKKKFIYDKIYAQEVEENVFSGFYSFVDSFDIDRQDSNGGLSIGAFLTRMTEYELEEEAKAQAEADLANAPKTPLDP